MEHWWLPAPPDPGFAWDKFNALRVINAHGWYDFDCGCLEPGSVSDMLATLTASPDLPREEAIDQVWQSIYGEEALPSVREAYQLYEEGKACFPIALSPEEVPELSLLALGLGLVLFGPFIPEDLRMLNLRVDPRSHFSPFHFFTPETIPVYRRCFPLGADHLAKALDRIQSLPGNTGAIRREQDSFEIHYRHFRALANYADLAEAVYLHSQGSLVETDYRNRLEALARNELENTLALNRWIERNPYVLGNPCWLLTGKLEDCWPGLHWSENGLKPKIESLQALIENRPPDFQHADLHQLAKWLPPYGKGLPPMQNTLPSIRGNPG
jgi:hypothetical protein